MRCPAPKCETESLVFSQIDLDSLERKLVRDFHQFFLGYLMGEGETERLCEVRLVSKST